MIWLLLYAALICVPIGIASTILGGEHRDR